MQRRSLLWHIFPAFLAITVLTLVLAAGYFSRTMRAFHLQQSAGDLTARALVIEEQLTPLVANGEYETVQELCVLLGKQTGTRFTVVLSDGEVIGDTEEDPALMNNHADRPEIIEALAGRTGQATRYSATLQHMRLYVGVPGWVGSQIDYVVRTSHSLEVLEAALRKVYLQMALGGLVLALAAGLVSFVVARRISVPLRRLQRGAQRFARGELDVRLTAPDSEEIGALAEAMNEMAEQLSDRIDTIVKQRNEYEAVLGSMVEGVVAVDPDETIIGVNQAAARLLGISSADSMGRSVQEVVRNPDLLSLAQHALISGAPVEGDIVLDRGEELYLQVHATNLQGPDEQALGALLVLNDVTRLRRLENMRRDFVANVSHELRTPITSIKGFVETLIDSPPESRVERERFLEIIMKQADRLNSIIADLLSLSRIEQEAERSSLSLDAFRICDVIQSAVIACTAKDEAIEGRIVTECPAELTVAVNGPLLEQAVVNLVDNALKYSEPQTSVLIAAHEADGRLFIAVQDHGRGIDERHFSRLFERFYRVDKARSRKLGGTGLGLAIVKHIVQAHRGEVEVESEVGQGSRFTIVLPVVPEVAPA